jgi:hypothetical protein
MPNLSTTERDLTTPVQGNLMFNNTTNDANLYDGTSWARLATYNPNAVSNIGISTDNAIARYDSSTGKLIQNSGVIIDDANSITGVASISAAAVKTNTIEGLTANPFVLGGAINSEVSLGSTNIPTSITGNLTCDRSLIVYDDFSWGIPHFEISQGTTGASTPSSTWSKVFFASTDTILNSSFLHESPNKVKYPGLKTRLFNIKVNFTVSPTAGSTFEFSIHMNGNLLLGSLASLTTPTANADYSTALNRMLWMNTNDYVEVFCRQPVGGVSFTCKYLNFSGVAIPTF